MLRSLCFAALLCVASTAGADPITFSNDDVNLGSGTVIPLTNEFAALGLSFTNVYRYIDERDPFPESPDSPVGFGISPDGFGGGDAVRVDLVSETASFSFDWWTIHPTVDFSVTAYGADGSVVATFFSAADRGTSTLIGTGPIKAFTFGDPTSRTFGSTNISTLDLSPAAIPEPQTFLLLAAGLVTLAYRAHRRRSLSH
jgi:hypothetical protein